MPIEIIIFMVVIPSLLASLALLKAATFYKIQTCEYLLTSAGISFQKKKIFFNLFSEFYFNYFGKEIRCTPPLSVRVRYPAFWKGNVYCDKKGNRYLVSYRWLSRYGDGVMSTDKALKTVEDFKRVLDELCGAADQWDKDLEARKWCLIKSAITLLLGLIIGLALIFLKEFR